VEIGELRWKKDIFFKQDIDVKENKTILVYFYFVPIFCKIHLHLWNYHMTHLLSLLMIFYFQCYKTHLNIFLFCNWIFARVTTCAWLLSIKAKKYMILLYRTWKKNSPRVNMKNRQLRIQSEFQMGHRPLSTVGLDLMKTSSATALLIYIKAWACILSHPWQQPRQKTEGWRRKYQ
jgi:hypothetical protein